MCYASKDKQPAMQTDQKYVIQMQNRFVLFFKFSFIT